MKYTCCLFVLFVTAVIKCCAYTVSDAYGGVVRYAPEDGSENVNHRIASYGDTSGNVLPLMITADKAEYDQKSGDFSASGNVLLEQNGQVLRTEYAEGNMKTGDVILKRGGDLLQNGVVLHCKWAHYNFLEKEGKIEEISGVNNDKQEWYSSPNAVIQDGKVMCKEGARISKCPARKHPPCLSVEAKVLEVIPNDRMIAKDCWVKVRGEKVLHRDRWVNYFNKKRHQTKLMPHIAWDDDHGMEYSIEIEQPLWNHSTVSADLRYFGWDKWKPVYCFEQDAKDWEFQLTNGWVADGEDWYKKQMNWELHWKRHRLVEGLPLTYNLFLEHGLWQHRTSRDDGGPKYGKRSWHTEYGGYLYHDPVHFFNSKANSLNVYVGRKWTQESLTGDHRSTNLYGATLTQNFGKNTKIWTGYYQSDQTSSLFDIANPDMAKEFRSGMQFTTSNKKDVLSGVYRFDVGKGERYEYSLTWLHHFCCFDLELIYEREYAEQDHSLRAMYYCNFM